MARLRISIVFESGARIGPGKAKLLESIRDTGSISAAARDMGMSYKRAWLSLDSINQAFTEPVPRRALAAHRNPRRAPRGDDREIRFAEDSLLEGDGFELPVPRGWIEAATGLSGFDRPSTLATIWQITSGSHAGIAQTVQNGSNVNSSRVQRPRLDGRHQARP